MDDDDEREVDEMFNNTMEEKVNRRELRRKYRETKCEIIENRDDLVSDGRQLNRKLNEISDLYEQVRNPREAVCDSEIVKMIANLGRQKAQELPINLVKFQPLEFTEKLITFMLGDRLAPVEEDQCINEEGWRTLGLEAIKCFNRTPSRHFMYGTFERGEPKLKEKMTRVSRKDKDGPTTSTAPQELNQVEKNPNQETTTEEVERVLGILRELYIKNQRSPICYFEFVTNPNSFSLTMENIFHVAFLVKDGHARIYLDADKLPVIEPILKSTGQSSTKQKSNQMIVKLNKRDWENIIKTFEIKKPQIPQRHKR